MYIQTLEMKNFKSFENIQLEFHPELTVLVGNNGSGKTSILEGASIALSTMFIHMNELSGLNIEKGQVHLKTFPMGSTFDVQPQYPVVLKAKAMVQCKEMVWERSLNSAKGRTTYGQAIDMIEMGAAFQKALQDGKTGLILPLLAYYSTSRLRRSDNRPKGGSQSSRSNGYIDCMSGTANIKLMMDWFSKMTVKKYQNQESDSGEILELEAVYSAMEACFQRVTGSKEVKIQYNLDIKDLEVFYQDSSKEMIRIPLNQLSDGYRGTISLVADIAYRMAVLNPQLFGNVCRETGGIVLIDEVDLHLHPIWQQRILGDLRDIFPKIQFIVTTHAPSVLNTVKCENIVLLEQGKVLEPAGEVYGRDTNTIISCLMNSNERPKDVKELFQKFYQYIDGGDAATAEETLNQLKETIGEDDPEIAGCNIKLKLLEMRSKK